MRIVCFLASLEDDAYDVLRNIMDMFELGEIKGQIVKKANFFCLPDFAKTAYIFRQLMGQHPDTILKMLEQLQEGELTTAEMSREASFLKHLNEVSPDLIQIIIISPEESVRFFH